MDQDAVVVEEVHKGERCGGNNKGEGEEVSTAGDCRAAATCSAAIIVIVVFAGHNNDHVRLLWLAEVTWSTPMRLERRSNVVAVAASLALMARRAKKMKRNCRFAIAALQHLVQQIARTHAVS